MRKYSIILFVLMGIITLLFSSCSRTGDVLFEPDKNHVMKVNRTEFMEALKNNHYDLSIPESLEGYEETAYFIYEYETGYHITYSGKHEKLSIVISNYTPTEQKGIYFFTARLMTEEKTLDYREYVDVSGNNVFFEGNLDDYDDTLNDYKCKYVSFGENDHSKVMFYIISDKPQTKVFFTDIIERLGILT